MSKLILYSALSLVLFTCITTADMILTDHGVCSAVSIGTDQSGDIIYLGLTPSGIWKTNDGGSNWTQINDRLSNSLLTRGVPKMIEVIDPDADTVVVNAITNHPLEIAKTEYHTFDGGSSWGKYNPYSTWPDTIPLVSYASRVPTVISRNIPNRAHLLQQYGFCTLSDNDWRYYDLSPHFPSLAGFYCDVEATDTLYVYGGWELTTAENSIGGIYKSNDGALSLNQITPMHSLTNEVYGNFIDMHVVNQDTIIALTKWQRDMHDYGPILCSYDRGETWSWGTDVGLPYGLVTESFVVVPEIPGRIIVGFAPSGGAWISHDYGNSWNRLLNGLPNEAGLCYDIYRNPYSGHLFLIMDELGLFRSDDYGDSWFSINSPPISVDSYSWRGLDSNENGMMQYSGRYQAYFSLGTETNFSRPFVPASTDDYFKFWPYSNRENQLLMSVLRTPFWPLEGSEEISEYLSIASSVDNGITWSLSREHEYAIGDAPFRVRLMDDSVMVATDGSGSGSSVSYDYGNTWQVLQTNETVRQRQIIDNTLYGYHIDLNDMVASDDYGLSWTSLNFPDTNNLMGTVTEMLALEDTLYLRAGPNAWAHTAENGWEQRGVVLDYWLNHLMPWDIITGPADTMMVAGCLEQHVLYLSNDMGWTWEEQEIVVAGYQGEICDELKYDPWRDRLWVDTGLGLAYMDDPTSAVGDDVWHLTPADHLLLSNYPNPFNTTTTIQYTLATPSDVTLRIYDLLGRRVATLVDEHIQPGGHQIPFDATSLSSGSYFVKLQAGELTLNRRITLIK